MSSVINNGFNCVLSTHAIHVAIKPSKRYVSHYFHQCQVSRVEAWCTSASGSACSTSYIISTGFEDSVLYFDAQGQPHKVKVIYNREEIQPMFLTTVTSLVFCDLDLSLTIMPALYYSEISPLFLVSEPEFLS